MEKQAETLGAAGGGGGSVGGSSRLFTGALVVATIALSVLCLMLSRENKRLKGELVALASAREPADRIRVGERLGGLTLVRRDGSVRELWFSGEGEGERVDRPALVFIMAAGCGYCERVTPVWEKVLMDLGMGGEDGGGHLRVAAVQTDAADAAGIMEMPGPIPVHMAMDAEETWLRRVHIEPSVLLIDGRGEVLGAWMGLPAAGDEEGIRGAVLEAVTRGG